MPWISEFYGIAIYLYYADHNPPHFHAVYAGEQAEIDIRTGEVHSGILPVRVLRLVREWALLYREQLLGNWEKARAGKPLNPLPPLT